MDNKYYQREYQKVSGEKQSLSVNGSSSKVAGAKSFSSIAKKIASGHAFSKHIDEFADLGIKTEDDFAKHIEKVTGSPVKSKSLKEGRIAYYDTKTNTVVIYDPSSSDLGSVFRPVDNIDYYNSLK